MTALERIVWGLIKPIITCWLVLNTARVSRHGASGHSSHYTALTGASVTPVHTTNFRSGLILSPVPEFIHFHQFSLRVLQFCPNFLCRNATVCWVLVTTPGQPQHCDGNSVPHSKEETRLRSPPGLASCWWPGRCMSPYRV